MECPLCGGAVVHPQWTIPLQLASLGAQLQRVERDVNQAARWTLDQNGTTLGAYLNTTEGTPYADYWTTAQVQQADQNAAMNNP